MKWIKANERLPGREMKNVLIRYDEKYCQRELRTRGFVIELLSNGGLNLEWLDETPSEEPDQDELWKEIMREFSLHPNIGEKLKTRYILTRK